MWQIRDFLQSLPPSPTLLLQARVTIFSFVSSKVGVRLRAFSVKPNSSERALPPGPSFLQRLCEFQPPKQSGMVLAGTQSFARAALSYRPVLGACHGEHNYL